MYFFYIIIWLLVSFLSFLMYRVEISIRWVGNYTLETDQGFPSDRFIHVFQETLTFPSLLVWLLAVNRG